MLNFTIIWNNGLQSDTTEDHELQNRMETNIKDAIRNYVKIKRRVIKNFNLFTVQRKYTRIRINITFATFRNTDKDKPQKSHYK